MDRNRKKHELVVRKDELVRQGKTIEKDDREWDNGENYTMNEEWY